MTHTEEHPGAAQDRDRNGHGDRWEHGHSHDDGREHRHSHGNGDRHSHGNGGEHGHSHDGHGHPAGLKGLLHGLFIPHSHDSSDSIDDALEASTQGIRAVKISLMVLGLTAVLQLFVVFISGSVALLADTVHNFSDALTAVPLWIAFLLGRRAATRRYTYGYGRAEDLAGLFIVAMIALSAIIAGFESVRRLFNPQPLENLGWVLAAGVIGFAGNEIVALYRIRIGRRIGSAALVADGVHARADGFTSLAVVLGVFGVWLGFPLADPIIGLLITAAIAVLLWGTARDIGRRLLDGVDPNLVDRAHAVLEGAPGVGRVANVQMRWTGHRLHITTTVITGPDETIGQFAAARDRVDEALRRAIPSVGAVSVVPAGSSIESKVRTSRAVTSSSTSQDLGKESPNNS